MSICSFAKEFNKDSVITVESCFIADFLPISDGDAVKVYLYGLYVCNTMQEIDLPNFCENVNLTQEKVLDAFKYWEEYDLVSIISTDPLLVKYLPLSKVNKPRKYKAEKYSEFAKAVQHIITDRMISTTEYTSYFDIMENYNIKPEAMLMLCKYCVDLKGANIGFRYILAVVKDFVQKNITTYELIEKELSDYLQRCDEIGAIITALGSKRKPEIEDLQLFNKWRKELGYQQETLIYIAKKCKKKTFEGLDTFILELFSNKMFTKQEVDLYVKTKEENLLIAKNVCSALSIYVEVLQTVVDNYVSSWLSRGYDGDTLIFLANYCFKKNRRTLNDLNEQVTYLFDKGLITLSSVAEYFKSNAKIDEFIKKILVECGIDRRPVESDRKSVETWSNWGFNDEMILQASKRANGATRPFIYINAILSNWKNNNIFTVDKIPPMQTSIGQNKTKHFDYERTYTKEELDAIITNIDDLNF